MDGKQKQSFLALGVAFLVIGIAMFTQPTGVGIAFVGVAIVFFMYAAGSFGRQK